MELVKKLKEHDWHKKYARSYEYIQVGVNKERVKLIYFNYTKRIYIRVSITPA